jgi:hypothetical protein
MVQTETTMAKELVFKMRLDEADRKRLDELAEHYSAPAATVVRMLIKEKCDEVASLTAGPRLKPLPELYERAVRIYFNKMSTGAPPPDEGRSTWQAERNPKRLRLALNNERGRVALLRYDLVSDKFTWLSPKD